MDVYEDENTEPFSQTLEDYGTVSIKRHLLLEDKNDLELRRSCTSVGSRLPKCKDPPPRTPEKVHWDYLLAEMKWLSADFDDERKYKNQKTKKICKCVQAWRKEKDQAELKKEQEIIKEKKQKAKFITKHIKLYWDKIDKIVTYKHKSQLYERRAELMDRHLQFMLKQTEDYTTRISSQLPKLEDSHISETPYLFNPKTILRPYQLKGLDWLISLYEQGISGILADEMGLGKTIETISLLAYLAGNKGIWGPHLIIVPTSTILNWECEFKRFCPAFKIMTYYGNLNERKEKRKGWTNPNSYHICITSYQLAIKDVALFRRRRWVYMILDEAHNIKNFKSTRWQTLLHFNTKRRLLLTGTPLQNSLMELWSLMHFLMPALFRSRGEFAFWFSNPLNTMVEGDIKVNNQLILRLHTVLRPFILRRLKNEVEKEMPKKYFHVLYCPLSKRQKYLYEDYISRRSTKDMLSSGSLFSMMSVLMQLRKVCNHPDLFETRPIDTPFASTPILIHIPNLFKDCVLHNVTSIRYNRFANDLTDEELEKNDWTKQLVVFPIQTRGISLFLFEGNLIEREQFTHLEASLLSSLCPSKELYQKECRKKIQEVYDLYNYEDTMGTLLNVDYISPVVHRFFAQADAHRNMKQFDGIQERYTKYYNNNRRKCDRQPVYGRELRSLLQIYHRPSYWIDKTTYNYKNTHKELSLWEQDCQYLHYLCPSYSMQEETFMSYINICSCYILKVYSQFGPQISCNTLYKISNFEDIYKELKDQEEYEYLDSMNHIVNGVHILSSISQSEKKSEMELKHLQNVMERQEEIFIEEEEKKERDKKPLQNYLHDFIGSSCIYKWNIKKSISFPDKHLLEFDCGKFQMLNTLLPKLHKDGSRCLIFTQMSKMLDILEKYLNNHSYTYLRMDGSTGIEERQRMMEQFNTDNRIFIFILSTRSGGLGINLIGANTVIFYDSDWNPSMDSQAQDRAHRIGQTRDVHIYRLISESTIEENILKKANQKRYLNKLSLEEGQFTTTSFFKEFTINDILGTPPEDNYDSDQLSSVNKTPTSDDLISKPVDDEFENVINKIEDQDDAQAAVNAAREAKTINDQNDADIEDTNDVNDKDTNSISSNTTGITSIEKEKSNLLEEQSIERVQAKIKGELKIWAGKNADYLKGLEKKLPSIQQKCIELREVNDPIPEVTPEALQMELQGLEEEEEIWEEEQKESMELAEYEVREKDRTPSSLEAINVEPIQINKEAFFMYREEAKKQQLIDEANEQAYLAISTGGTMNLDNNITSTVNLDNNITSTASLDNHIESTVNFDNNIESTANLDNNITSSMNKDLTINDSMINNNMNNTQLEIDNTSETLQSTDMIVDVTPSVNSQSTTLESLDEQIIT
ncbi:hypothetical protein WA158_001769 [Blastocystis sp. Blastoise]